MSRVTLHSIALDLAGPHPAARRALRIAARQAHRALLDAILPPLCPGCRREISADRWLCTACRRALRPVPAEPLCIACRAEQRRRGGREAGLGCRREEHAALLGRAGWWMEAPLDGIIHAFKYDARDDLGRALARLLIVRVESPAAQGVTAVPLHRTRLRERGYNQAALLGRAAAATWGIPWVPDLLERGRATRPQARLAEKKRAANVADAFRAVQPGWVQGRDWVLVDDVCTTGATLLAAARVLTAAGARRVVPVALALA